MINKTSLVIIIFAVLVVAILLRIFVIPYANVLWDEATFLVYIQRIHQALQAGNWADFWKHTTSQYFYPFLQSWVLAIISSPFKFSISLVRTVNLIWLLGAALGVYWLGVIVSQSVFRDRKFIQTVAVVSVLFYLASPLLWYLHSVVLKEAMSAVFSLGVVIAYLLARRSTRPGMYLLTGVMLSLQFLTKYQYAVFLSLALVMEGGITFILTNKKISHLLNHLILTTPVSVIAFVWIMLPGHGFTQFQGFMMNAFPYMTGTADKLTRVLFYPRGIMYLYSLSPIIGLALLVSFVLGIFYWRRFEVRITWLVFMLPGILLAIHTSNMQERYLSFVIGGFFVVAVLMIAKLWEKLSRVKSGGVFAVGLVSAILSVSINYIISWPSRFYHVGSLAMRGMAFNQLDYNDTWYNYDVNSWSRRPPQETKERLEDVVTFVVDNVDAIKPVTLATYANELAPDYLELFLAERRKQGKVRFLPYSAFVVGIAIDQRSRLYTRDFRIMNEPRQRPLVDLVSDANLELVRERKFDELGVVVAIFGRRQILDKPEDAR